MATTETIKSASLGFVLGGIQKIQFDSLDGTPSINLNFSSNFSLATYDLATAVTPSATNPVEVASTKVWGDKVTASGTSHTLDLSALARSSEVGTLDLTGLKIQGLVLQGDFDNTADVAMVVGATNGYNILNDASAKVVVPPGGVASVFFPENTTKTTGMPDVGAADKDIDFSSAMSNFKFSLMVFAG